MTTHIDFRTLPANIPSLCIPRVFPNIDEKRIRRIFDDLALGEIQAIDFVSKKTEKGESFNRIFVHFKRWFNNKNADTARERLLDGKEIKIIYDDPWFWKVSAYRPPAQPAPRPAQKPARPHIDFDSEEDDRRRRHQEHNKPRHQEHNKPRHQEPEEYVEEMLHRRIKADRKKAQYQQNDEFGRDKSLRQAPAPTTATATTAPVVEKQASQADQREVKYNMVPTSVRRRILNKKPQKSEDQNTKKRLEIEGDSEDPNLEDGEVEE